MEDALACYGCGSIFEAGDSEWTDDGDDMVSKCPECGSNDVVTYETYLEDMG